MPRLNGRQGVFLILLLSWRKILDCSRRFRWFIINGYRFSNSEEMFGKSVLDIHGRGN
jgi:hypothetical protein